MFENCNSMAELNEARVEAIRGGNPAIFVNKEYAKRKAVIISGDNRGFKRIQFVPVPIPDVDFSVGIDFAYEEGNTICVSTVMMNG